MTKVKRSTLWELPPFPILGWYLLWLLDQFGLLPDGWFSDNGSLIFIVVLAATALVSWHKRRVTNLAGAVIGLLFILLFEVSTRFT
ncbi:hypothetical protein [Deinococcus sp.]|uniref:hypothetical protein n=1 Tax=Deinococcus sp. TaxID=47478 RepID=UPI003B5B91FE